MNKYHDFREYRLRICLEDMDTLLSILSIADKQLESEYMHDLSNERVLEYLSGIREVSKQLKAQFK